MASCSSRPDDFAHFLPSINPSEVLSVLSSLGLENILQDYLKTFNLNNSGTSPTTGDKVIAHFDVKEFKPEEISVKLSGENIVIEGKQKEKQDEHGYISRHFVRRFVLPEGCDSSQLKSKMSSDGILTITLPKVIGNQQGEFRDVPIVKM